MDSQLSIEVGKEVELLGALIPAATALHLAVVMGRISLCRMPSSAAVFSRSETRFRFDWAKRLVNSKSLPVSTHPTVLPIHAHLKYTIYIAIYSMP